MPGSLAMSAPWSPTNPHPNTLFTHYRRQAEQEARARGVRLARALDDAERLKKLLEAAEARARDGRGAADADAKRLAADVARLERQKGQLLLAFRKQARLVDVLRRQKAHLEAARSLALTEEEFARVLGQGQE